MRKNLISFFEKAAGYSLIELCIALLVVGTILAAGASGYSIYKKDKVIKTSISRVSDITGAINDYRSVYGTYPCPARMNVPRTDPNYGKPDCTSSPAPGACLNGICVQRSPDATKGNVSIGAVPFRVLNIDDEGTYDSYGSRLYYAVTQSLTVSATYKETGGGIEVFNDSGLSVVQPPASIRYLVFSTGPDQAGGYSRDGVLVRPCVPARKDGSNCDFNQTSAVFRTAMPITANTNNHFDDIILPYIKSDPPLWKRTETNPDDIVDLSPRNIGISAQNPAGDLTISGNVAVRTDGVATGDLHAFKLCDAGGTDCFEPRNISGDVTTGTAGDGMECPSPYEYMVGIKSGGADCKPITTACPPTKVVQGVDATGQLICVDFLALCPAETKTVCGVPINLPGNSPSGTFVGTHTAYPGVVTGTPTVGINRAYRFTCNNGLWHDDLSDGVPPGTLGANYYGGHDNGGWNPWVGDCSCVESVITNGAVACAAGYSGTFSRTITTTCIPTTTITNVNTSLTDCTCVGNSGVDEVVCPPPNHLGASTRTPWTQACVGNVLQPKVYGPTTGSCSCLARPDITRTVACPANSTGTGQTFVKPFNITTCSYGPETLASTDCVCNNDTKTIHPPRTDCPACSAGVRDVVLKRGGPLCEFTVVISDTPLACTPAPFAWRVTSTLLYSAPAVSVPKAGDTCSCGAAAINCKIRSGMTDYVYSCSCQPR